MEYALKSEVKKEISRIVDLWFKLIQLENQLLNLKKISKLNTAIPVATITKVATIIRKQSLDEEEQKWDEIKEWVDICS